MPPPPAWGESTCSVVKSVLSVCRCWLLTDVLKHSLEIFFDWTRDCVKSPPLRIEEISWQPLSQNSSADLNQRGARGWVCCNDWKKNFAPNNTHTHTHNCNKEQDLCKLPVRVNVQKHTHVRHANTAKMSSAPAEGPTADCLHQLEGREHPAWPRWDAGTGARPLVVVVCSSRNVDLAGSGCRGWLRGWQCPSQSVVKRWLTSLGHLHFLWLLSLGGKTV